MDIIGQVSEYIRYVKLSSHIYEIQKSGIELFINFLKEDPRRGIQENLEKEDIEYFLNIWVPKQCKYLSEIEAYNIVYATQEIYMYIKQKTCKNIEEPIILDRYGSEYVRLYKSRRLLAQLSGDPVILTKPLVISFLAYKEFKQKKKKRDTMSMYEQGIFKVDEINKEGYICLNKIGTKRYFRVLFKPSLLANFKVGDILHITLKRRIFFVYWEIEEVKGYYLPNAMSYF